MLHFESNNKQIKQNQSIQMLMAGVAGILAGAAGVTALALSDKDIRKRVGKRAKELSSSLQEWTTERVQTVDQQTMKKEKSVEKMIDETKENFPLEQKQEVKMKN